VGIGLYKNVDAAVGNMKPETAEVLPHPEDVERYEQVYQDFGKKRDILFELSEAW
jgi:hypothetical protein